MIIILLADDHAIVRGGLKELLARQLQGVACGEADDADQVVKQVQSNRWDLVILDITMPGRSGLEVLGDLRRLRPDLPVLVLSMHAQDQFAKRMLKAGAFGYLKKSAAPEELIQAVRRVLAGRRYVSAALAERLAFELHRDTDQPLHETLSPREFEILIMLGSGKSVSRIAEELHLSGTTVSTYRARILEKLNMASTAELIRYAIKNQLVD